MPSELHWLVRSQGQLLLEARWSGFPIPVKQASETTSAGMDTSVPMQVCTKPFKITESQVLRFSWEVFNLSNSVRFNAVTGSLVSGTFGNYSTTLTTSRRMQFSLRYSF